MKIRVLSLLAIMGLLLGLAPMATAEPIVEQAAPVPMLMGVAESFRNPTAASIVQPRWSRITFSWTDIQPEGNEFSRLGLTLPQSAIDAELARGTRLAGLLQFTPPWAQRNPADGQRSPPRNLELAFDDPNNFWGQYVFRVVSQYRGKVDEWVLWNEPDFRPSDPGAGGSFTWAGTDAELAQLLKVGYLAAKKANPGATVSFPGTSYWVEELAAPRRTPIYERILNIWATDPGAAANNYYHDVVALNLYQSPDSIYMVSNKFKGIQQRAGIDKPLWLTETNAMPTDDAAMPCFDRYARIMPRVTMQEQAAFGIQGFAMATASGYQRAELYKITDGNEGRPSCDTFEPAVWGVTRDDGSARPIQESLRVTMALFHDYTASQFVPLVRETQGWAPWPEDQSSYYPNWQIYQVAMDKADGTRVTTVWNGDGVPQRIRIRKNGGSAQMYDKRFQELPVSDNGTHWVIDLPAATARGVVDVGGVRSEDPAGYYFIGGDPLVLVEYGVPAGTPVVPPALGEGGAPDFALLVTPADQTVGMGQPADFFARSVSREGFADPISLRVTQWSSQRFPDPKDPASSPLPFSFAMPETINPGDQFVINIGTAGMGEGGIYFLTIEGSGGGVTRTFDIALVVA